MAERQAERATDNSPVAHVNNEEFDLDEALRASLRHGASQLSTHLKCLERDICVGETKTKLHCYFLRLDASGRVRVKLLAEYLRDQIIDYAIPRKTIKEAYRKAEETGSMAPLSSLHERAKGLFTGLAKSGEGGELLLFAMAEAIFGITQIICKMSLKTSSSMHYHGADGVYAEAREDSGLNLYWGESKIYGDASAAIRNCLQSLAPFLRDPEGSDAARNQDILLINEFANFSDERLVEALKQFLDPNDPSSLSVCHRGFAMSAFDSAAYPAADIEGQADEIAAAITEELANWVETADRRICHEGLERFDIHFICVPLPSAEEFRTHFLKLLGFGDED